MLEKQRNHCIIANRSVDGILTSAALMRHLNLAGASKTQVLFADVSRIDSFDVMSIKPESLVTVIDIAVNREDVLERSVVSFIKRILEWEHTIVSIIDTHGRHAWERIIDKTEILFGMLSIKPITGRSSSGALFLNSIKIIDPHVAELCKAADSSTHFHSTSRLASIVYQVTKSKMHDDKRIKYLVHYFAEGNIVVDDLLAGWISEYDKILSNTETLKQSVEYISETIARVDTMGMTIDTEKLLSDLYLAGKRFVIIVGNVFNANKGQIEKMVTFYTSDKSINMIEAITKRDPLAYTCGDKSKVIVNTQSEAEALYAIYDEFICAV